MSDKQLEKTVSEVMAEMAKSIADSLKNSVDYAVENYEEMMVRANKNISKEELANEKAYQKKKYEAEQKLRDRNERLSEWKDKKKAGMVTETDKALHKQDKKERRQEEFKKYIKDGLSGIAKSLLSIGQQFQSYIDTYQTYQSKINTRLFGSGLTFNGKNGIENRLTTAIGNTGWVKTADIMNNVVKATEEGIAYNIEQRAFLQTISENIATTFNAFDASLLRIIRIQQSDTTAERLGLEAGLTRFLNANYLDTSYLNGQYTTVRSNLTEALSTMSSSESIGIEYQIQKWLGSLFSVGLSDSAVSSISNALGMLGSGDVSGLASNSGMQNLLAMSASRAGLSYADMLSNGLDESGVNKLLEAMVKYLQEIASNENQVVKSQYASLFGLSMSDLTAASNISNISAVSKSTMSSVAALSELAGQFSELGNRMSIGQRMSNLIDNLKYSVGSGIAGSPASLAVWEIANLLQSSVGGIAIPSIAGFDLNTTVAQLMQTGLVGVNMIGAIGDLMSGASAWGNATKLLSNVMSIQSGAGTGTRVSGFETSEMAYVGSGSGSDIQTAIVKDAEASVTGGEETTTLDTINEQMTAVNDTLGDIYKLLGDRLPIGGGL